MDPPSQPQRRRKRPRASESGNTPNPPAPQQQQQQQQIWGTTTGHPHSVNARPGDTVQQQPTFAPQQLDPSHPHQQVQQVSVASAQPDGLMNGYGAPHAQYPEPATTFAQQPVPPPQAIPQQIQSSDPTALGNRNQNASTPGRSAVSVGSKTDGRLLYQSQIGLPTGSVGAPSPVPVANQVQANRSFGNPPPGIWNQSMAQPSPAPGALVPGLQPPPEGIYRTFEDLLEAVQKAAKDQGYGIVKLRASNYRDGKATRYDLVCDRGGVKYNSTAKKRNPSTRKIDCPFRAKAVCEVQLSNQWRFVVQEPRHNHEARVGASVPGQENTPIAQSIRSMTNKLDRVQHDLAQGFQKLEAGLNQRLDNIEKRLENLEVVQRPPPPMMGGGGPPNMGAPSMPPAAMGGPTLGSSGLSNGGLPPSTIVDSRLSNIEARVSAMERGTGMDGLPMMDDDPSQLAMMVRT